MGSKQTGGGLRAQSAPRGPSYGPTTDDFIPRNPDGTPRAGPRQPGNFLSGTANTRSTGGGILNQMLPNSYARTAAAAPYMNNLNLQPGVQYDTAMQQRLASNSIQSQQPGFANSAPQSSFMTALNPQAGGNYNTDMQKRMANASAMSQGLPPPYPGY